jgi:heme exporter protein D
MFDDLASFVHMDGHGLYVWSSYFIALLVFAWNVVQPIRRRRKVMAEHQRRSALEATTEE